MQRCQFLTPRNIIMAPMRRKSHGSIRSPHVKRDSQSQVVIEGWLFKLEGGALKQWKQRWCVLADFCLFFYKGPHEEKITSSILLPSYKVNPCSTEDKISRKFAFKAEHQNMKTYYFAAEDKESMKRWMNAMSLASIMQKFVKSDHYDATFSSTSNDDEDSGFTSYRSKRFPNQMNRTDSGHDSSFRSEPLKHRSNSYGDRMGEVYLSSDDKYPNMYKSSPSHLYKMPNPPVRQPLYANAPPKPKRMASSDSFGVYPNDCYDPRDSQYQMYHQDPGMRYDPDGGHDGTVKYRPEMDHQGHQRTTKYLSDNDGHDRNIKYFPHDNVEYPTTAGYPDYNPACYNDNARMDIIGGEAPDPYRNQPPRPRSADFLEREPEGSVATTGSGRYPENPQPPRPKSSLECYNRYMDSEEGDFDDYREAVRMQADQLYANKNPDRSGRFRHPDPNAERLNIHYVGNSQFEENSSYPVKDCDRAEYRREMNSSHPYRDNPYGENDTMVEESPTNRARKESMQRLLEWKQRMLQSPLSRKNQLRSNSSSDTGSPMNSPMKYQHQSMHSYRGRKELDNRNASFHKSATASGDDYMYSSEEQIISGYNSEQYNSYGKSYKPQTPARAQYNDCISDDTRNSNSIPIDRSTSNSSMPEISTNNVYQKNVMYCVDSENNEILFSYDDNSPTDCNISNAVQSSHYPPMMHSFSTMPNVSDIGNETQNQSANEGGDSLTRKSKNRNDRADFHHTSKVPSRRETTTYSSDDEDVDEKPNRGMRDADACDDVLPDRYRSSSPDYVNIGAMSQEYSNDDCEEMFSSQISYKDSVNRAVLKPLVQASRSLFPEPAEPDSSIIQSLKGRHSSDSQPVKARYSSDSVASDPKHHKVTVHSDPSKSKTVNDSFDSFDDEMEFGIRREDYYRASQIFYSSTRVKNKAVNPRKKEPSCTISVADSKQASSKNYNKDKTLHLLNLDKDIGLPICDKTATKSKVQDAKPKETFEFNENVNTFCNKEEIEKTPEDLVKLKPLFKQVMTELTESVTEKCSSEGYAMKHEAKKNLSYEEMRGQLLRRREAPPPNIVQDRIKKFETGEKIPKSNRTKKPVTEKSLSTCYVKEKHVNRASVKRNHYKASRSRNSKRILHSDSEAVARENTDESSDDLTMKSAPILLSPLSSVLADLRKTADSGRDNEPSIDQVVPIASMKEYFCAFNEPCLKTSMGDAKLVKTKDSDVCKSHSMPLSSFKMADEVEYLPMSGLKEVEEPEYVLMNGNKFLPSSAPESHSKVAAEDEHVYNEPFSPPPSFLHDVYEKQKMKQFQYEMKSSSSEESLTENIYEKPMQKYASAKSLKSEYSMKSVQETNSVLMSSLSCSNVTNVGQSRQGNDSGGFRPSSSSRSKVHHYEQAHLSVSVPDLLQLQEMKDSDASDADDEASRDFDTSGNAPLPSYQTFILSHFSAEQAKQDLHSSFDSEIISYTQEELSGQFHRNQQYNVMSPNPVLLKKDAYLPKVKPLPSYETLPSGGDSFASHSLEHSSQEAENNSPDNEKKIHVRKLRVYTKGKKPEAPKIFPVPFNVEESELDRITERKDAKHSRYENFNPVSGVLASVPLVVPDTNNCLSENVAYLSRAEASSYSSMNPPNVLPNSFAPDVVPTVQVPPEKLSSPSPKSPNSAPYYYSDLFGDFKFANDVPYFDKVSPPRNNPALLNNVRSASPYACKGDVGRKVNKINTVSESDNNRAATNEMAPGKQWRGEAAKKNLKCALDMYQCSESKYLDAEKNKYEAGHTLEKTRSNSTMSYFKQRSSTPDLNSYQYQSDEPVYENIIFQSKDKLQRRLSQSLEAIPNATDKEVDGRSSPVYENIEFFHQLEASYFVESARKSESITRVSESGERQIANSCGSHLFPEKQFCDPVVPSLQQRSQCDRTRSTESDGDFLDQSVLRRVSAQHFFGQNSKLKNTVPAEKTTVANSFEVKSSNNVSEKIAVEENVYDQIKDPSKLSEYTCAQRNRFVDSDSTSLATSSCDEASVDSDGRYRMVATRMRSLGISGSISDSDSNFRESNHLRKLVQQSEGLMCKGKRLSVSAGDLLGKTHEELVLLLIQLRRNQAKILRAKEKLVRQLDNEHRKPQTLSQNYRELQRQRQQLETQYEITKPLVTLVDNMVKLGSLYGNSNRRSFSLPLLDSSQDQQPSNTEVSPSLEQSSAGTSILSKLLTEENNLQKRIAEIYSIDKGLRHETDSISSLHQDKEMLEYTLSGMRNKILDHQDRPAELQKLRKQQRMIEKELVRVKKLLSASAKKIEDAASKNDQMAQEIHFFRQILQQALKTGGAPETKASQNSRADIEAELTRLQNVLDELANHRHEINNTVEKFKSDARSSMPKGAEVRASPTGVAGSAPLPLRKKHHSTYLETDLDTMTSRDLAVAHERDMEDIPVYVNAEEINISNENVSKEEVSSGTVPAGSQDSVQYSMQDINEADDRMKRFYGILPKEKPCEIKTVRIVKRQSEKRSRERDKKRVTYDDQSSVWVVEEPDLSSDDLLDLDEGIVRKATIVPSTRPTSINLLSTNSNRSSNPQSAHERLFGSGSKKEKPVVQQERSYSNKKSKRRHYTVSGYQYMLDPQFAQYFRERPRSRDDVDMERCLRTANTPDIVRSTIKKNEVYDDKIIERELGLPQKIEIPERYVEVEPERLSASEKLRRSQKAENICKMLSETTTSTYEDVVEERSKSPEAFHKKLSEEKRKRAHLLSLNRALAREVVERSKAVAVLASLEHMMKKPLTPVEEDLSPLTPLPITQQRYSYLT